MEIEKSKNLINYRLLQVSEQSEQRSNGIYKLPYHNNIKGTLMQI